MHIQAIVYTSNTGNTAQYAKLLGERTGLPVYTTADAQTALQAHTPVLYMGWIRASTVMGYAAAASRYAVQAVCAVGMGATGSQVPELRKKNRLPEGLAVFTVQGGLDVKKLRGMNLFMINFSRKAAIKQLKHEKHRTEAQNAMLVMLTRGASFVDEKHLAALLAWLDPQTAGAVEAPEEPGAAAEK